MGHSNFWILYNTLHSVKKINTHLYYMKPDPMTMKAALRKREEELQKIIRQMKQDNLHSSPVYRNLSHELETVKVQLTTPKETFE
jgi:hypothetical protein